MNFLNDLYSFFWGPIRVRWFWFGFLTAGLGVLAVVYLLYKLISNEKEKNLMDEVFSDTKIGAFEKTTVLYFLYDYLFNYETRAREVYEMVKANMQQPLNAQPTFPEAIKLDTTSKTAQISSETKPSECFLRIFAKKISHA